MSDGRPGQLQVLEDDGDTLGYATRLKAPGAEVENGLLELHTPTADEKAALVGSHGTPTANNPYVTSDDPRVSPPPPLQYILWDDFDEVDGLEAVGRRPLRFNFPYSRWEQGAGDFLIDGQELVPAAGFADGDFIPIDPRQADVTICATVTAYAGAGGTEAYTGIMFRIVDDENFLLLLANPEAGLVVLYEATTALGVVDVLTKSWAVFGDGTPFQLSVSIDGNKIWIHTAGQLPAMYETALHAGATKIGFRVGKGAGSPAGTPTLSNIVVVPAWKRSPDNPTHPPVPATWKSKDVAAPTEPVWDAVNERYVTYVSGFDTATNKWKEGASYSTKLLSDWVDDPSSPQFVPGVGDGYILGSGSKPIFDPVTNLWYRVLQIAPGSSPGVIVLPWRLIGLSSPNLTNGGTWTRINGGSPIVPLGPPGSAYSVSAHDADARRRTDGLWEVIFGGWDGTKARLVRGLGTSLDNLTEFSVLNVMGLFGVDSADDPGQPTFVGNDPLVYSILFVRSYFIGPDPYRYILRADTFDGGANFEHLGMVLAADESAGEVQAFDPSGPITVGNRAYTLFATALLPGGAENLDARIVAASHELAPVDIVDEAASLTPAASVVSETSFGQSSAVGSSTNYAREDHTHGTPAAPTSVTGNAGTATALQTARNIDGQSFNGTANITVIAPGTHAASSKATPVDADELPLVDSAASNVLKKLTWLNLRTTLAALFAPLSHTHAASDITSGSLAQAQQSILSAGAYLIAPWEQYPAGNVSCTAASANSVSVVAFIPRATISVLSVHFDVQVLFSGGLCSVGVYSANGNTKLIDSGTKSTTSTGAQSTTLGAAVTLYANTLYWIAYTHDNTTSAIRGIIAALTGATNILNAGTVQVGTAANAATAGALPSSLGSITGASRPIPMIKLQG